MSNKHKEKTGASLRSVHHLRTTKIALLFVGLWLICFPYSVNASTLSLPNSLVAIEDQAFEGCSDVTYVTIPDGVLRIGEGAFRSCTLLNEIVIPDTVTQIRPDAFSNCGEALWFHTVPGSAAVAYARANHIDYDAETDYRALIVGQNYTGTDRVLYGPINDARAMRFCLAEMTKTTWLLTQKTNLTADGFLSTISAAFEDADGDDVSLLYYSGHGTAEGALLGSDLVEISPQMLRAQMDNIPGRKVVIVDACYSGNLIAAASTTASHGDFNSGFLAAFKISRQTRSGELNADSYYVITAAGPREESEEGSIRVGTSSKILGYFTYSLCEGMGWNGVTSRAVALAADANEDGAVSIPEAAVYARNRAQELNIEQTAAYSPASSAWFAPFRP